MAAITVTFNNYGTEAVVVMQSGEVIATLPPVVPITYTSTALVIDPGKEVHIQQQVQGGLTAAVCAVPANQLKNGDVVDDNLAWGEGVACNITPPTR